MPDPTKPTDKPRWATDGGLRVEEPSEPKKDEGWDPAERPASQFFNWLLNNIYLWIDWFDFKTKVDPATFEARLTLTTGVPVTTTDVISVATVYLTPFRGNRVSLYNGTEWVGYTLAEISIAVSNNNVDQMRDLFLYDNAGVLTLEEVLWTNDTTRATALTKQDGIYVKTGTLTKRYVGSFRSDSTLATRTNDSQVRRHLWNYYNRVKRFMQVVDSDDTWDYTTATWRQVGGVATNQLDFVVGVIEDPVEAMMTAIAKNSSVGVQVSCGIGINGTTIPSFTLNGQQTGAVTLVANQPVHMFARGCGYPGVTGRNRLTALEKSAATGTTSWIGADQSGANYFVPSITGEVMG